MKSRVSLVLSILFAVCASLCRAEIRTWTSSGGDTVSAEFVADRAGFVELQTAEGKRFRIHVSELSEGDRAYVSERLAVRPGKAPGVPQKKTVRLGDPDTLAAMKPGKVLALTAAGETGISYHLYTPGNFSTNSIPPLVIAFSPGGSGMQMVKAMKASAEQAGWLLIGVDLELKMEDELLADIFKRVPHQLERICLAGFSGGAMRAYILSSRIENVAGIIAYGGWLGGKDSDRDYCRKMAVAIVNGENDKGANAWVERDKDKLRNRDCEVKVFKFPGGHQIAPAEVSSAAIAWIEEQWRRP